MQPRPALWLLAAGGCALLGADVIDRIAITVANQVITASQIDEEVRVTAFLNHEKLDLSLPEKKASAGRLIDQALIKREMDLSRYPLPALSDADSAFKDFQSRYPDRTAFDAGLLDYGITEGALKEHLRWQLTVLRFIDYRFRPGIQIPDEDVQSYYRQELLKWREQGLQPIPSLEDKRAQIEEILTQQQIDQSLDQWLADARKQATIRYLDEALK
jgi:peptidyl-prolyl cis-trans isomerase SurA